MTKNTKIAVTGSIAYDRIMNFPGRFKDHIMPDKIHMLNVSFCADTFQEGFGGCSGNIAYNLKLLGLEPVIFSQAGSDFNKYKKWYQKNKISLANIKIYKNEVTASAYIITDQDDNQITAFYPGAMKNACSIKKSVLKKCRYLIVAPGNKEDMIKACQMAQSINLPYVFDFGQQITNLSKKELKPGILGSQVIIANDYEMSLMLKKTGLTKKKILDKINLLVTTLGPKGSLFETKKEKIKIPIARPKNTSDPTGAGDAFRAGLIKGLLEGYPLEKVGRLAGLVSVYTVEKYGTQTHKFSKKTLAKRYKNNFKQNL
ncbi:MAG: carbohydrate kinase family protein [Patescibacteria group bacterium]|nr:carbohydrate kinase family protein [Patescibacteria group bacterium]